MRLFAAVAALVLASAPLAAQAAPSDTVVTRDAAELAFGRSLHGFFAAGQADSLWARADSAMRAALQSADRFADMQQQVAAGLGDELEVTDEWVVKLGGFRSYFRAVSLSLAPEPFVFSWTENAQGRLAGAFIQPESQVKAPR